MVSRAVAVGLVKDDMVFMLKRADTADWAPGMWHLPSGKVEPDEAVQDAAVREVLEEVGAQISADALRFLGVARYRDGYRDADIFFFVTDKWTGEVVNCEPDKCQRAEWFDIGEMPEPMPADAREIMQNMDTSRFIEMEENSILYTVKGTL